MELIATQYFTILFDCFKFDIWFLTQWWAWAPAAIPVIAYFMFMCLKWPVLTMPIWIIFRGIFGQLNLPKIPKKEK